MVVEHAHGLRQRRGPTRHSNAAQISAGAAALLSARRAYAKQHGLVPRARFVSTSVAAADPVIQFTAVLDAALLQRLAAVRGRLSLCADQAAAAKWWLSMPMASVSAEGPMPK